MTMRHDLDASASNEELNAFVTTREKKKLCQVLTSCCFFSKNAVVENTDSPVSPKSTASLKKNDSERELAKVFCDGLKLRAVGLPWRYRPASAGEVQDIEVLLIESFGNPGRWNFPGGCLEDSEDVASCAARETKEESGVEGTLGCFLGAFDDHKSRSYVFCLHVHTVLDDGSEQWCDPGTVFECDGMRRRRWYLPADARPLVKTPGILDAFLEVSSINRVNPLWRSPRALAPRILFLSGSKGIESHCTSRGKVLHPQDPCPAKEFAIFAAALWEADLVVAADISNFSEVGYALGLAVAQHCPALCVHSPEVALPPLVGGDSRIRCHVKDDGSNLSQEQFTCSCIDNFLTELGISVRPIVST